MCGWCVWVGGACGWWVVCVVGGRIPLSVSRKVTEELIIMEREVANSVCACNKIQSVQQ